MKRFKNILVYLSGRVGDDQALTRAAQLAEANNASLTIIDVLVPTNGSAGSTFVPPSSDKNDQDQKSIRDRIAMLERIAASLSREPGSVQTAVTIGRPFIEIVKKVLQDGHDLVVMAADSLMGVRLLALGATSMHLMRKCPCPVWVIKPSEAPRFQNVMASIDANDQSAQGRELNTKVLQLASSIARNEQCSFHIAYAWRLAGSDAENVRSEISDDQMNDIYKNNHREHKARVQSALSGIELGNIVPEFHLPCGDPASVIPDVALKNQIDLIVMGTVSRSGVAGLLMGNTAELVLRQVDCSVLTAKPDGFQSPIVAD